MDEIVYTINITPHNCSIQEGEFWHCYKNNIRDKYARSLFVFGYHEFKGAQCFMKLDILENIIKRLDNSKSLMEVSELGEFNDNYLSDCIKICLCFENYFKYKLLSSGYVIHKMDKSTLYKDLDLNKPIKIKELLRLKEFDENDIKDSIPKMRKTSYALSTMLNNNNDFHKVVKIPNDFIPFLKELIDIRNKLHNCYEITIKYSKYRIEILKRMDKFLQSELNEEMSSLVI